MAKTTGASRPWRSRQELAVHGEDDRDLVVYGKADRSKLIHDQSMNSRPINEQCAICVQLLKFADFVFFPEPKI